MAGQTLCLKQGCRVRQSEDGRCSMHARVKDIEDITWLAKQAIRALREARGNRWSNAAGLLRQALQIVQRRIEESRRRPKTAA